MGAGISAVASARASAPVAYARRGIVAATPGVGVLTDDELDLQFPGIYDRIVAKAKGAPST